MSLHRAAAKRDGNEPEIIQALRQAGAVVVQLSQKGYPDLSVGFRGVNYLLEVKGPKGELTPDQEAFFETWDGQAVVVRTVDEALKAIGAIE